MDKDLEAFMEKNKQMDKFLEDELDQLMKEDATLKNLNKKNDDSIDLDDLSSDEGDQDNKKDNKDEELEKLEKEGLEGLENLDLSVEDINKIEISEKKVDKKESNKKLKNESHQETKTPTEKGKTEKLEDLSEDEEEKKEDLYRENVEKIYHERKKMKSAGVLEDEKRVMDEIVEYKKKNNLDCDFFTIKKDLIDGEIQNIQNMIISEVLSLEGYKSNITVQLNYEKKLLETAKNDKSLKPHELKVLEERINKRVEIINMELQQEVPEEDRESTETTEIENHNQEKNQEKETPVKDNKTEDKKQDKDFSLENRPEVTIKQRTVVEIKDQFLYETLKKRLDEYKLANEYFEKHNLVDQAKDAFSKAREIQKSLIKMENGEDIDQISMPEPVSPDYINGCPKQERFDKFSKLIKEYNHLKNEMVTQRNKVMEKFNQLEKKEQNKIKEYINKDLRERNEKIENYEKFIKKLMETLKNEWIPCPQYSFVDEEEKIEKILEDVPQNAIQINIESTTYDKEDAYIYVSLSISEKKTLGEWVYLKEFPKKLNWKLEKSELNAIHRKYLEVSLYRTHWYWPFKPALKGSFKAKLDSLKSKCELQSDFDMVINSGRLSPLFNITVSLRQPVLEKEYITKTKSVIKITKAYPEFNKNGVPSNIHSELEVKRNPPNPLTEQDLNSTTKTKQSDNISKKPAQDTSKNIQKKTDSETKKPEEKIDPSEFSKEDLEDPDNQDNMMSLKVMEMRIAKMDQEIKKIEGRPPQKLRSKFLQTKCRYNTMKEQIMEGAISIEGYVGILNKQIQKDKRLIQYFKQIENKEKANLVFERLSITVKEVEEAIPHLKK